MRRSSSRAGARRGAIRQHAVGLNFIDVYYRTGLYKAPELPFIAGNEAAGEVLAVGPGVTNFHPGDRVAYYHNLGAYASERNIPWEKLVKLPDHITYEQGAVLMLKGLTVWYLLHKTFKVEPHHRVLIHAAAGGIGMLACQWARAMGAHVIGTVGTKEKAELALANGCDHVILYNEEDFVARVKQISRNELCDVVYDGVGKPTFPGSLSCLKPRGLFVSFGNASGPVPPFAIAELNNHGSLFATRPKLNDYVGKRSELLEGADTLFAAVINGKIHVPINHAYALKDAAKAHIDLESRATTGVDPEAVALRPRPGAEPTEPASVASPVINGGCDVFRKGAFALVYSASAADHSAPRRVHAPLRKLKCGFATMSMSPQSNWKNQAHLTRRLAEELPPGARRDAEIDRAWRAMRSPTAAMRSLQTRGGELSSQQS